MAVNRKLVKVFEYALNQEQTGKSFFEMSIQRMGVGAAVSAFKRLVEEEQKHIEFINKVLDNLRTGEDVEPEKIREIVLEPTDYFDERSKKEFLAQCLEGSMVPDVTVFNTAWLIERDLSEFYQKMADQADGKPRHALRMLANWEKGHEKFFKEYRDKLTEVYSNMPWGG